MSLTPKHYLCVSRLLPAVRSNIASAVVGRAIMLGEAADTLFEATTMPSADCDWEPAP